jgi:hypothetical protein
VHACVLSTQPAAPAEDMPALSRSIGTQATATAGATATGSLCGSGNAGSPQLTPAGRSVVDSCQLADGGYQPAAGDGVCWALRGRNFQGLPGELEERNYRYLTASIGKQSPSCPFAAEQRVHTCVHGLQPPSACRRTCTGAVFILLAA